MQLAERTYLEICRLRSVLRSEGLKKWYERSNEKEREYIIKLFRELRQFEMDLQLYTRFEFESVFADRLDFLEDLEIELVKR